MTKKLDQISLIIDFDSTLTQVEGLDELANIALANNPNRAEIIAEIRHLTELGMTGELSFSQSLSRRIALLQANREHLDLLIEFLKTQISASFLRNRDFLAANAAHIFVLSGGFKEFIVPVALLLGLREENVFANTFVFDEGGNIGSVDENNFLAGDHGKVKTIQSLHLTGECYRRWSYRLRTSCFRFGKSFLCVHGKCFAPASNGGCG